MSASFRVRSSKFIPVAVTVNVERIVMTNATTEILTSFMIFGFRD